jgi:hypothetical protein
MTPLRWAQVEGALGAFRDSSFIKKSGNPLESLEASAFFSFLIFLLFSLCYKKGLKPQLKVLTIYTGCM